MAPKRALRSAVGEEEIDRLVGALSERERASACPHFCRFQQLTRILLPRKRVLLCVCWDTGVDT